MLPSIGLGTLAGLISWRSNKTAPIPVKIVYTAAGVFVSTLVTHQRVRENIKERISSLLSDNFKEQYRMFDERIGMFGADIWNRSEDFYNDMKSRFYKE